MHTTHNRHSRSGSHATRRNSFGKFKPRPGATSRSSHSGSFARGRRKQVMPTFDPSRFINANPVQTDTTVAYTPTNSFESFGLDARLTRTIASLGITNPTPIQDQIIPHILKGRDVIGLAETGTGKTAAFLIPLIEKTIKENRRQTLILTPTRELALQIEGEFRKLARGFHLFSVTCVGGMNIVPQIKMLRKTNHFVIGTPGRVLDLMNRGNFKPEYVTTVVLDEADRMLDMGFINDMKKILTAVPDTRETLLFSATMTDGARGLVHNFLKEPITVSVKKADITTSVKQDIVSFKQHSKFETLTGMLADSAYSRVLIFGAMKHSVEKLSNELSAHGITSESIHGNKSHGQRQRALENFKRGSARVLVATDVAARGIHVNDVSHVINYDLPNTFEDYVHRIGRTGRGDKRGIALTFVPQK